ncbi:hypothetical protein VSR34_35570 [Paraburkholderia sp. JHI2823]|uniref:hypothetical protein n=1 Tax=Paraburkholderia sp. JHI2823 TaxID=3112960 RepID=UPI00316B32FF
MNDGVLRWRGGTRDFFEGEVRFLCDPVIDSMERYGNCRSKEELARLRCYGARQPESGDADAVYHRPEIAPPAAANLAALTPANLGKGGLLLWHKWEKAHLANHIVAQLLTSLV